jgi:uncharacterized protein YndB with AHSA1/START domain
MTTTRRALVVAGAVAALPLGFTLYTVATHWPSARERTARLPGDAMISRPTFAMTQAVTIDAPPERVWPWLAQMGVGRAGWYSYDAIDNGGVPSARVLLGRYQRVAVGDVLPAAPGATDGFVVLAVAPPNDLVLGGPPDAERGQRATWEFNLRPLDGDRTRLVVRVRVADHWLTAAPPPDPTRPRRFVDRVYAFMARLPKPVLFAFAGFGHRVMENEQLRGLKRRAER